ncbi:MAG: ABC transporter ATP-binding protein [Candidatus Binatia bacterium]
MGSFLEVVELTKRFGGIAAVDCCSFAVSEGAVTGLIGPNGAGKTTVFNLISGLLRPDSGEILFEGRGLSGLRPHKVTRRGISRTFQMTRELKEMTVLENMVVQSRTRGVLDLFKGSILEEEREKAMALLEFVGIAYLADERAKTLSYGQKKLLEFASILMCDPRLILLDEPGGGVNPKLLDSIMGHIRTLNERGMTFLIVEHKMDMVMNLCDPIIVMAHGKVLAQGPQETIQSDKRVLEAYLGGA